MKPQMNTDEHGSGRICTTKVQILCRLERILLRGFFALFASSRLIPDSAFTAKGPSGNKVYILLLAPRPAGKARATSIPGAVCKERATQPAGLRAAARRGAAAGGHLRRCRSSTMPPHRLRRGALHLPARRSRQNAHLIF